MEPDALIDEIEMAVAQLAAMTSPDSAAQKLREIAAELETIQPAKN